MLFTKKTVHQKRTAFQEGLKSGRLLKFPGSFSPLVSQMIEKRNFDGVYVSGAVLSSDLFFTDIGLTTLTEVSQRASQIAAGTDLPVIVDGDTGFGESINAARTVLEMERLGLSGVHLEDQILPKKCGHLDNKELISLEQMSQKVAAAVKTRKDKNFVIIARTDAKASEGMDAAINRAKAYIDAGADMIFPEALQSEKEMEVFRKAVSVPLLFNMTEFGKTPLLKDSQIESLGFNVVIYPVTTWRLALGAVDKGLQHIQSCGTQNGLLDEMQDRKSLYEFLQYSNYQQFDEKLFNLNSQKEWTCQK